MFEILRPSDGKVFANADETQFYTALILAPNDSIGNYHEVDLPEPVPEEEPDPEDEYPILPEPVDEEEEIQTPLTRAELTAKVEMLEDELAAAKILLGVE